MSLARAPELGTEVPVEMLEIAGGPVELVWRNEVGGLTGRVLDGSPRFVKWNPLESGESLEREAARLRWLRGRHPAPQVVDYVRRERVELLVTVELPGRSAVDPVWIADPHRAIVALAAGLRALHSLPVDGCPFEWSVPTRIAEAEASGRSVPAVLRSPPAIDRLVVCHGDSCAPNTLLGDDGQFLANVDFGRLGVADRWADLAVATMSMGWNYADFEEGDFWDAYGAPPDESRIAYYRQLYQAT